MTRWWNKTRIAIDQCCEVVIPGTDLAGCPTSVPDSYNGCAKNELKPGMSFARHG
jgi:hypothetical protein